MDLLTLSWLLLDSVRDERWMSSDVKECLKKPGPYNNSSYSEPRTNLEFPEGRPVAYHETPKDADRGRRGANQATEAPTPKGLK
ncbi:hypothetical protein ANO14919_077850 [Xylariales sp. No.14919]|nr:hypothetical protein ANO14919_077850 [Xylariales sp. No.14919]